MTIFIKNKYTLQIEEFKFICCMGKKGSTTNKKEGDKKTPQGIFEIGNLYYRKDRIKEPVTSLKCIEIKSSMGWCDDINYPKKWLKEQIEKILLINKNNSLQDIEKVYKDNIDIIRHNQKLVKNLMTDNSVIDKLKHWIEK